MSIGGIDRVLFAPAGVSVADAILQVCRDLWPKCIFQDSDGAIGHEIDDPWVWMHGTASDEFFVFTDRTAYEMWNEFGASQENSNSMLHFIVRPHPGPPYGLFEVTVVVDQWDESMRALDDGLQNAFQAIYHVRSAA
ncbi:MAG: hypothetical protein HY000_10970 [Planctomycetes bacterium]|nr:hypothetical protein [Planctomycetota bacterium]